MPFWLKLPVPSAMFCCRRRAAGPGPAIGCCRPAGPDASHLRALKLLRLRFGQGMREMGVLRKQGLSQDVIDDLVQRWCWLVVRKVRARAWNEQQHLLTDLKRTRQAER